MSQLWESLDLKWKAIIHQKPFNRLKIRKSVPHDVKVRYAYYKQTTC
jgi:hypothetical protein